MFSGRSRPIRLSTSGSSRRPAVIILERVLRDLPTGLPQSAPPVTFMPSDVGEYRIEIKQLYGKQKGEAVLHVPQ